MPMKDAKRCIRLPAVLPVPDRDAQILLEAGNGDAALLYLHIARCGGTLDVGRAARELHRSDRDIEIAAERLAGMGLLSGESVGRPAPVPEDSLPEYEAREITRSDPRFQTLVGEVQMALGRVDLPAADLNRLFGIYHDLAMPPEVILMLIQYCKEESEARYGKERRVGFAFIEKVAYDWFHREILTYEQAEQWLRTQAQRRTELGALQRELGLYDQKLTPTVRQYLTDWLDMGFSTEAISIAADRTVTNTGGLKWKYMDSILRSWDRMGLHTPAEIERGDKKPNARAGIQDQGKGGQLRDDTKTMAQVKRLREKMNNS